MDALPPGVKLEAEGASTEEVASPLTPGGQEGREGTTCHVCGHFPSRTLGGSQAVSPSLQLGLFPELPRPTPPPSPSDPRVVSQGTFIFSKPPPHLTHPSLPPSTGPGGPGWPMAAPGPGKTWFCCNLVGLWSMQPSLPGLPTPGECGQEGLGGLGAGSWAKGMNPPG